MIVELAPWFKSSDILVNNLQLGLATLNVGSQGVNSLNDIVGKGNITCRSQILRSGTLKSLYRTCVLCGKSQLSLKFRVLYRTLVLLFGG